MVQPYRSLQRLLLIVPTVLVLALLLPALLAFGAEVGTDDQRVSDMAGLGTNVGRALDAATAYNSSAQEYLVVWSGTEGDVSTNQDRIYGQRINARTGLEVGSNDYLVSEVAGAPDPDLDAQTPKVVYNSVANEYFVVFVGNPNPNPATAETEVFGQRLSGADGSRIGTAFQISLCGSPGDPLADVGTLIDSPIDVAFNATNNQYLVVLRCDDVGDNGAVNSEFEIYGRLVNADGTLVGSNDFQISFVGGANGSASGDYDAEAPDVAWNSDLNEYLVIYGSEDAFPSTISYREIYGRRVSSTGTLIGASDTRISNSVNHSFPDSSTGAVAYNPVTDQYLVVWGGDRITNDTVQVHGEFLSGATLATVGSDDFVIGSNKTDSTNPQVEVIYNSVDDEFLVSWNRSTADDQLTVQRIDANGAALGTDDQIVTSMAFLVQGASSLAYNSRANSYLLAWAGSDDQGGQLSDENELFVQHLSEPVDMQVTKSASPARPAPGDTVTYTLTYTNAGPNRITDAVITDSVSANLTGVSCTVGAHTGSTPVLRPAATCIFDIDTLLSGQGGTITITGQVAGTLNADGTFTGAPADGTVIPNTANIASATPHLDSNTGNNTTPNAPVTVDYPPRVVSIVRAGPNPINSATVDFTVTFSEPVTGGAAGNFSAIAGGGLTGPSVTNVAGSGATRTVTVNTGAGDGTVGLNLVNGTGIADVSAGKALVGTPPVVGEIYTIDKTPPTVTINQAAGQADPVNAGPINFRVVFSEPINVASFTAADVSFTGSTATGTLAATITQVAPSDGTTFNVAVSGMTGSGTVVATIPAGGVADPATNTNLASTSTDNSVTYDITPPTVTVNQAAGQSDPTNAGPITFTVVFNEPINVASFTNADVTLGGTATGTLAAAVAQVAPNDGTTFNVAVSGMTGSGTVTVSLGAGVVTDVAGNGNTASTATDNTVTYDITPPTVTVNQAAGQADPTNAGPISFTAVFNEAVNPATFTGADVSFTGSTAGGPLSATVTQIAPNDGTTFNVAVSGMSSDGAVVATIPAGGVSDVAGNLNAASTSTDNSVAYDVTAPTVDSINRASANPTNATSVDWTVTFSEAVDGVASANFSLVPGGGVSGAQITNITGSGSTRTVTVNTGAGDGTLGLSLTDPNGITDVIGNTLTGAPVVGQVYTIDKTPPPAPVTNTPANGSVTNDSTPPVSGTAEANSTVTVFIDGSAAGTTTADGSGSWSFTPTSALADGSHTARATATDAAGNSSVDSNTNTFTVDTTAPDTTITSGPDDPTNSTSASFSFTGNDGAGSGVTGFECRAVGLTPFLPCDSPANFPGPLPDGTYTFEVRAIDNAGNVDPTPASYTWTVDTTAPNTTITASPPALSNSADASFSFTGSDGSGSGVAAFACQIDGGGFVACANPLSLTGLSDGSHTFQVQAIDAAGNTDPTPASYTWTIDTTPPAAPVTLTPANGSVTNDSTPPVSGTAEANSTVTVFIDGSAAGTTTADSSGNWSFTPGSALAEGSHTARARATDAAGNSSVDSNTNTFTVDTIAPDTTITASPTDPTNSTSASFSFTGDDGSGSGVASFECRAVGITPFLPCTSPASVDGPLPDGSYTFEVQAIDNAGNVDPTPASYTWTVDTTAPDTTITASPPALSASANASFSFSGGDGSGSGVAAFACQIDGGGFSACTSPQTYTGLSDGSHTFQVRAIDAAGNPDPTPASYTWTIDTTPPPAPVTVTPANGSVTNNGTPTISGTAEANSTVTVFIDGSSAGTTTADGSGNWSFTPGSALAEGSHTARARATDAAGNSSVDSNTNTFTVDTTAPTVTVEQDAGQADPTDTSPVRFVATFSEPVSGLTDADVSFSGTATTGAVTVTEVAPSDGTTYEISVAVTGDGTVVPSLAAGAATDAAGNSSEASTSNDNSVRFDIAAPTIISIERAGPNPTSAASVDFTVTFSEDVTGVANGNFDLTASGVTGASITGVSGSGATWTVTVDTGSGDGTIRLDMVNSTGVTDVASKALSNIPFTTGEVYDIDKTAPTVTVEQAVGQADPTGVSPVLFTVVFSEPVNDFADADVRLSGAAGATTATVSEVAPNDGTTYAVSVSGMNQPGAVIAALDAGVASDAAGNGNAASTSADNSVTFDPDAPVVTGVVRASPSPTNAPAVDFTVTFSEIISGIDASDFTLTTTGLSGASVTGISGSGSSYVVTVSTGTGSGTLRLDLVDNDSVVDTVGNPLGGAGVGNGSFSAGQVYTIDRAAPTASLTVSDISSLGGTTHTFTVVFSDNVALDVSTLDSSDIRVVGPNAFEQLAAFVSVDVNSDGAPRTATYQITAPGGSWDRADLGTYTLTLVAGAVSDTLGTISPNTTLGSFAVALNQIYLPIIGRPSLPDLVVQGIQLSNGTLSVTIRNQGQTAVTAPFWVDLYINPSPAPTGVNQIWQLLGSSGAVWSVRDQALPIGPGQSLTLTVGGAHYRADLSSLPASLPAGTRIFAQVDSANTETTYGGVLEGHEESGGAYNNIGSITLGSATPINRGGGGQPRQAPGGDLPTRGMPR